MFENYEDAKTAILGSILDEINKDKSLSQKATGIIKGLYKSVDKFKLIKGALKFGTDMFLTGGIGTILELHAKQIIDKAQDATEEIDLEKVKSTISDELNSKELRENIREFQKDFAELLEESKISRLVIFVDELDRCRPDTILDTLEAIKLFLFKGKVAFVIGADERHISYAVKSKFKDIEGIQIDIGKEYLEKLIQYPIRIPRLNADEVEMYIACLLLQTQLGNADFDMVLSSVAEKKKKDFESFKMNSVIELFKGKPGIHSEVVESITVAHQLASVLSNGLHGNPRQCKRFLNSMYMRLQMATYKNKELDRKILAKIMMLEYIKPRIFNKIAEMAANNTLEKELQLFELGTEKDLNELKMWHDDIWFLEWCKLEPKLSDKNLNTYFYFTRTSLDEKISQISSFLSPEAEKILESLMSKSDVKINQAIEAASEISDSEASAILEAMYSKMSSETSISKEIMDSFLMFAQRKVLLVNDALSYLQQLIGKQVPLGCAPYVLDFAKKTNKLVEMKDIVLEWAKTRKEWETVIDNLLAAK